LLVIAAVKGTYLTGR